MAKRSITVVVYLVVMLGAFALNTAFGQTTDYLQQWTPTYPTSIYEGQSGQRWNVYTIPNQPQYRWRQPQYGARQYYFQPRTDAQFSARPIQPGFHPPSTQWGR